jgi:hypothetical protein
MFVVAVVVIVVGLDRFGWYRKKEGVGWRVESRGSSRYDICMDG